VTVAFLSRDNAMKMAREDFLYVRNDLAERGIEITPQQLLELMNQAKPVELVDEPGMVSFIKEVESDG
jgi:hypothetical protein